MDSPIFERRDADFEAGVRGSFARQRLMHLLGAHLTAVRSGQFESTLPFRGDLTQQHASLHAAAVTAIADSACGCAALALTGPGLEVLQVSASLPLAR